MAATAGRRGPYRFGDEGRLSFRCLPTDIDFYRHMNNARYAMLADVGRMDLFKRSGMMRLGREKNWWPMMGGSETVYVREIRLWARFDLISGFGTWQDTQLLGSHLFRFGDGRVAAMIMTTIGVYDFTARRFVAIEEVAHALGYTKPPRQPNASEAAFMASHAALRGLAKSAAG